MASRTPFTFFLDWKVSAQFAGLVLAKENGSYDAAGLDVRLVPWHDDGVSVSDKVVRMASEGELCAGCMEDNLIVRRAASDRSILAFGTMLHDTPLVLMSRVERGIRSIGDVRNKRVAMHHDGIRALEIVLALEGIPASGLDISEVGFDLQQLVDGRFDAVQGYTMTEPVQLAALGVEVEVLPILHSRLKPYAQIYFSERALITQDPSVFERFLRASTAGWLSVCAEPDRAAAVVARAMTAANQTEQSRMMERLIPVVTGGRPADQVGAIESAQWRRNLDTYAEFGLIDRSLELHEVVFAFESIESS